LQAVLLAIASGIGLYVLFSSSRGLPERILLSLLFLTLFHFADPRLIGPAPYPSSSVLRFFPVYLFAWYVSFRKTHKASELGLVTGFAAFLVSAAGFLAAALAMIWILRDSPLELSMHNLFARFYASGYFSLPVATFNPGIIWLICFGLMLKSISSATPILPMCIFGMFGLLSYYVGRAVPDNILAVSPLLFLLASLAYLKGRAQPKMDSKLFLFILFTLPIGSLFSPDWSNARIQDFKPTFDVRESLPGYPKDILSALQSSGFAKTDGLIQYGHAPAPLRLDPLSENPLACFPGPLQPYEEPMPHSIRIQLLDRYFSRRQGPQVCWMIVAEDAYSDRLQTWLRDFEKWFTTIEKVNHLPSKEFPLILKLTRH
jgi:hypothetical protein